MLFRMNWFRFEFITSRDLRLLMTQADYFGIDTCFTAQLEKGGLPRLESRQTIMHSCKKRKVVLSWKQNSRRLKRGLDQDFDDNNYSEENCYIVYGGIHNTTIFSHVVVVIEKSPFQTKWVLLLRKRRAPHSSSWRHSRKASLPILPFSNWKLESKTCVRRRVVVTLPWLFIRSQSWTGPTPQWRTKMKGETTPFQTIIHHCDVLLFHNCWIWVFRSVRLFPAVGSYGLVSFF